MTVTKRISKARARPAEIVREYGPFEGADDVHGVTFDGQAVWFAAGEHERLVMPAGTVVTGLESDGRDLFLCDGGAGSGRAVRRPKRP